MASKSLTKDALQNALMERERQLDEVRRENRRIAVSLHKVLATRETIRDEVADLVSEEIEALSKLIEEYQEFGTPEEIGAERAAMLRALGIDAFEWERVRWKYI